MPDGKRLWRTAKGDLVEDGHPEAVRLAYGANDALTVQDRKKIRAKRGRPAKQAPKPANKQAPKPSDK
jgi:hypothetical protein